MTQSSIVADALALLAFSKRGGGNSNIASEVANSPPRSRLSTLSPAAPPPNTKPRYSHSSFGVGGGTGSITMDVQQIATESERKADAQPTPNAGEGDVAVVPHIVLDRLLGEVSQAEQEGERLAAIAAARIHKQQNQAAAEVTAAAHQSWHMQNLQHQQNLKKLQQEVLHVVQQQQLYEIAFTGGAPTEEGNAFQKQASAMVGAGLAADYNLFNSCNPYTLAAQYAVATPGQAYEQRPLQQQQTQLCGGPPPHTPPSAGGGKASAAVNHGSLHSANLQGQLQPPQGAAGHGQPAASMSEAAVTASATSVNATLFLRQPTVMAMQPRARGQKRRNSTSTNSTEKDAGGSTNSSEDDANVVDCDKINRAAMQTVGNAGTSISKPESLHSAKKHKADVAPVVSAVEEARKVEAAHMRTLVGTAAALQSASMNDWWDTQGMYSENNGTGNTFKNKSVGGIVVQVGLSSGIVHTGVEAALAAQTLEKSLKPGGKAAEIIDYNERKSGGTRGRHLVLNACPEAKPEETILSINGVYQDWVLKCHTKARNMIAIHNSINGEPKRELIKQSRRYKHNVAQVTYSRKVSAARKQTKLLAFEEKLRVRKMAAGVQALLNSGTMSALLSMPTLTMMHMPQPSVGLSTSTSSSVYD